MLNASVNASFYVKDFQHFHKRHVYDQKGRIFGGIEQMLLSIVSKICRKTFEDNGILETGHIPSRKFLWLIPFTLAKKLLTFQSPVERNYF